MGIEAFRSSDTSGEYIEFISNDKSFFSVLSKNLNGFEKINCDLIFMISKNRFTIAFKTYNIHHPVSYPMREINIFTYIYLYSFIIVIILKVNFNFLIFYNH